MWLSLVNIGASTSIASHHIPIWWPFWGRGHSSSFFFNKAIGKAVQCWWLMAVFFNLMSIFLAPIFGQTYRNCSSDWLALICFRCCDTAEIYPNCRFCPSAGDFCGHLPAEKHFKNLTACCLAITRHRGLGSSIVIICHCHLGLIFSVWTHPIIDRIWLSLLMPSGIHTKSYWKWL